MLKQFKKIFSKKRSPIQTFTYYIPGPPERKSSYRETFFDREFHSFINKGYEILSIHTVPHQSPKQSGMWFIATVRALTPEAEKLQLDENLINPQDQDFEIEYEK